MDRNQKILTGLMLSLTVLLIGTLTWTFILYAKLTSQTIIFNNLIVKNGLEANFAPTLRAVQGLTGSSLFANTGSGEILNASSAVLPTPPVIQQFKYNSATADTLTINNISVQSTVIAQQTNVETFNQAGIIPTLNTANLKTSTTVASQTQATAVQFTQSANIRNLNSGQAAITSGSFKQLTAQNTLSAQVGIHSTGDTTVQQTFTNAGQTNIQGLEITNSQIVFNSGSSILMPKTINFDAPSNVNFTTITYQQPTAMSQSLNLLNTTSTSAVEISGTATINSSLLSGLTINKLTVNNLTTNSLTVTGNSIIGNLTTNNFVCPSALIAATGRIDAMKFIVPKVDLQGVQGLNLTSGSIISSILNLNSSQITVNGPATMQQLTINNLESSVSITTNQPATAANFTTSGILTTTDLQTQTAQISGKLTIDNALYAKSFGSSPNSNYAIEQTINIISSVFTGVSLSGNSVNSQGTSYMMASLDSSQCRFQ